LRAVRSITLKDERKFKCHRPKVIRCQREKSLLLKQLGPLGVISNVRQHAVFLDHRLIDSYNEIYRDNLTILVRVIETYLETSKGILGMRALGRVNGESMQLYSGVLTTSQPKRITQRLSGLSQRNYDYDRISPLSIYFTRLQLFDGEGIRNTRVSTGPAEWSLKPIGDRKVVHNEGNDTTGAQWVKKVGNNPSKLVSAQCSVEKVTIDLAMSLAREITEASDRLSPH
jgi:hypothetical protein